MSNEIEISYKFEPLFELLNDSQYPEVDTIILTGGRASSKSFNVAVLCLIGVVEQYWKVLYSRFTNTSIKDSIKEEVSDKIDILGYQGKVTDNEYRIETSNGKGFISFKGIKTGSKGQTANLKSLSGFNCFVVDEAEEIPSFETFKKVFYSIRSVEKRNISILILNPTTKEHWIYQEFFEKKEIEDGFCGIVDNIMYIHSSYLDVNPKFIPDNIIRDYERLKLENEQEYNNVVLGGWKTDIEGVLLPMSELRFANIDSIPEEDIVFKFAVGDPADKGGDSFSIPFIYVAMKEGVLACFVKDVIHSKDGIEVTVERAVMKSRLNFIEETFLEVNGVGVAAYYLLKKDISNHSKVKPFTSTAPKETRILSNFEFVKKYFVFDENYKSNPEYHSFIKDLTGYVKDGEKENKNKKDAIDSLCSASAILKVKYKSVLYG